jgi:prevent-host-death family protein
MRKIMKSTAKNLRFHTKEILDTVSRGEEVTITHRGKPCAKLIPIKKDPDNNDNNDNEASLFGIWEDYNKANNVADYVRDIRKGRYI